MLEGFDEFVNESVTTLFNNLLNDFWFCFIAILIVGAICIYHNHMRDIREYLIGDFKVFILITTMFSLGLLACVAYLSYGIFSYLIYALFIVLLLSLLLMIYRNNLKYLYLIVAELAINIGLMAYYLIVPVYNDLANLDYFAITQKHAVFTACSFNLYVVLVFSLISITLISHIVYYINYYSTITALEDDNREPLKHEVNFCENFKTHTFFERIFSNGFATILVLAIIIGPQFYMAYHNPMYSGEAKIFNRYVESVVQFRENQDCVNDEVWLNEYNVASTDLINFNYRPFTLTTNTVGYSGLSRYADICDVRYQQLQAIDLTEKAMLNDNLEEFNLATNMIDYTNDLNLVAYIKTSNVEIFSMFYQLLLVVANAARIYTIFIPLKLVGLIALAIGAIILAMVIAKKRYYHSYNIIVEHDYHIKFDKPQKIISSAIIICTTIVVLICNAIGSQTAADPYIRQVNDAFLNKSGQLIESLVYNKYGVENEEIISLCDEEISRYEGFVVNSEPLEDFKEENTLLINNALNLIEILNDIKADALDGIIDGKDVDVYIRSFVDNLHVVVDINQSQLGTIFSDNLEDSVEGYFDSDDE